MRSADVGRTLLVLALMVTAGGWVWAFNAAQTVDMNALETRVQDGRITLDGEPFTGIAIAIHDGQMVERVGFAEGLRHGSSEQWYADGTRAFQAMYRDGRRDGSVETWWSNGTLRSQAHHKDGVADGVQREWYRSGARFKELLLVEGQEAGLQRAWRENGTLYANYVAKDGRNFGLKRADLCFEISGGEPADAEAIFIEAASLGPLTTGDVASTSGPTTGDDR